jgi:hypothetical protein
MNGGAVGRYIPRAKFGRKVERAHDDLHDGFLIDIQRQRESRIKRVRSS